MPDRSMPRRLASRAIGSSETPEAPAVRSGPESLEIRADLECPEIRSGLEGPAVRLGPECPAVRSDLDALRSGGP